MRKSPTALVLICLALGLGAGVLIEALAGQSGGFFPGLVAAIEPIGTLWVNGIRMTVIPLMVPLLIVGVAATGDTRRIGGLGIRAFGLFFVTLSALAIITSLVGPWLFDLLTLDPEKQAALRASAKAPDVPTADITFKSWLLSLVPTNPVKAMADGALLPIVVFTLSFAFALSQAAKETRLALVGFFRGVSEAMLILVRWVLALAPIGVFALALSLGARLGASAIGALGYYVVLCIGGFLLTAVMLYGLAVFGAGIPFRRFAKAVLPAQAVALSSRSSLASLPALIEGGRELQLPEEVTGFVLPLGVSVYKLTSGIYWLLGALLVAKLWGIEMGPVAIITIAAGSVILNPATPGIPSGGLLIQAPLYAYAGLPLEGLGILIAIDTIPDMFKTAVNVTADLVVAALLGKPRKSSVG